MRERGLGGERREERRGFSGAPDHFCDRIRTFIRMLSGSFDERVEVSGVYKY